MPAGIGYGKNNFSGQVGSGMRRFAEPGLRRLAGLLSQYLPTQPQGPRPDVSSPAQGFTPFGAGGGVGRLPNVPGMAPGGMAPPLTLPPVQTASEVPVVRDFMQKMQEEDEYAKSMDMLQKLFTSTYSFPR